MGQCTAHAKHTGERCRLAATPGREVCRFHGGKSLRGVASPSFKTGKYAKDLPVRLRSRYAQSLNDSELLALDNEIALLETRLSELIAGLDESGSSAAWLQLQREVDALDGARASGEAAKAAQAINNIRLIVQNGAQEVHRWRELYEVIQHRRVIVESEQRRLVSIQQMITAHQALVMLRTVETLVLEAVSRHVSDADRRRRIIAEVGAGLVALAARDDGAALPGG